MPSRGEGAGPHAERREQEALRDGEAAEKRDRAGQEPDRRDPGADEPARAALPADEHPASPPAAAAIVPEGRGVSAPAVVADRVAHVQSEREDMMGAHNLRRRRLIWRLGRLAFPALLRTPA